MLSVVQICWGQYIGISLTIFICSDYFFTILDVLVTWESVGVVIYLSLLYTHKGEACKTMAVS